MEVVNNELTVELADKTYTEVALIKDGYDPQFVSLRAEIKWGTLLLLLLPTFGLSPLFAWGPAENQRIEMAKLPTPATPQQEQEQELQQARARARARTTAVLPPIIQTQER